MAQYVVTDTLKGDWLARLVAPTDGAAGPFGWHLFVSQRSPLLFSMSVTPTAPLTGTPLVLQATAVTTTLPVTGAQVHADIYGPASIMDALDLRDDGLHADRAANDGVYGALYTPTQAGAYWITTTLTGNLPGGPAFQRQGTTALDVRPRSAHFTQVYSDTGIDRDGDGQLDALRIDVGVALDAEGATTLIGTLHTLDGSVLGSATTAISGTAGSTVTVALDFDATLLSNRSHNGPMILGPLVLVDQSLTLPIISSMNVYTTASYASLDFAGWESRRAGAFVEQAIDANGNGLFDYLDVHAALEVRRAGVYTATALLNLGTAPIQLESQAVMKLAGESKPVSLTWRFAGRSIGRGATDGPYAVTGIIVEGPLGIAWVEPWVGQTQAYTYQQFEHEYLTYLPLALKKQ